MLLKKHLGCKNFDRRSKSRLLTTSDAVVTASAEHSSAYPNNLENLGELLQGVR